MNLAEIVLKRIDENVGKYRGNRDRRRYEIHATDLIYDFCLRQFLLCYKAGLRLKPERTYSKKTYLTFRIGDKMEDIARELLRGYKPPPLGIWVKDILIIGSPDIVVIETEKKFFVECKSIKRESFETLTRPIPQHEMQLQFYLWLANRHFHEYYGKSGVVLYLPKQEASVLAKAFEVEYDHHIGEKFESVVQKIKRFFKTGELPKRFCKSEKMAKSFGCSLYQYCCREE